MGFFLIMSNKCLILRKSVSQRIWYLQCGYCISLFSISFLLINNVNLFLIYFSVFHLTKFSLCMAFLGSCQPSLGYYQFHHISSCFVSQVFHSIVNLLLTSNWCNTLIYFELLRAWALEELKGQFSNLVWVLFNC